MRILVFLLASLLSMPAAFGEQLLNLQKAARLLFEHNPRISQARNQSAIARDAVRSTRGSYLPQLDFTQSWSRSNNPVYVFGSLLNQQSFGPENFAISSLNEPDPLTDVSSRLFFNWLLFDFGRREARLHLAEQNYHLTNYDTEALRSTLLQELVKRYYAVSLARQRWETAKDAVNSANSRLEEARNRVSQGVVVETDLLSAQVFQSRRKQEEIDASHQVLLALAALQELLGTEDNFRDYTLLQLREKELGDQELDSWIAEMEKNRPELKAAAEMRRVAASTKNLARSNLLPSINGWTGYEWHGDGLDYSGENWGAGIELKWNLFRGFSDALELSSAAKRLQSAEERERETRNSLKLQIQSAYYNYASAKQKLLVSREALQEANENRRIYNERYNSGLVTISDSLQAETAYNELRVLHSQNLYDLYVSYASLLAASGRSDEIPTLLEGANP